MLKHEERNVDGGARGGRWSFQRVGTRLRRLRGQASVSVPMVALAAHGQPVSRRTHSVTEEHGVERRHNCTVAATRESVNLEC